MLVCQREVGASARSQTSAIAIQPAEVKLESGLSHPDDDGGGCRGTRVRCQLILAKSKEKQPRGANKYGCPGSPSTLAVAETFNSTKFSLKNYRRLRCL